MAKVLIIEDDDATAAEIARALNQRGFEPEHASTGEDGLERAVTGRFDAITLDRMLPDMDGLAIAEALKARGLDTPVLVISALNDVDERVRGLRAGGDDYLTKPFALEEMVARVEVLIRRRQSDSGRLVLRYKDLELDLVSHTARRAGREIRLFPKESKLLEFFLRHPEQVLTRTLIFQTVWGYGFDPGTNLIDVHIRGLRQKLEAPGLPTILHTERGAGYRLSC
ncbi:MAG TPA: response regulator transcription factor [Caulobacteraceae bacterium]|jgi:two-component system OmpR family response regulator